MSFQYSWEVYGFCCIHKFYVLLNVRKIYFKLKRLLSSKYICVVVKFKVSFFSVKYMITLSFCVTYIIREGGRVTKCVAACYLVGRGRGSKTMKNIVT